MATGPGPQQRFNSNIIRISFPQIGGLVYLRAQIRSSSDIARITPVALVKGLPWGDFDLFDVVGGERDPELSNTDPLFSESVPIVDPVSDKMIAKYIYWAHRPVVKVDNPDVIPGIDNIIIDTAQWTEIYNHVVTYRLSPVWTRDQALTHFKTDGLLPGQDPDLVSVALTDTFGNLLTVPSPLFYAMAAEAGWTYHTEPGTPTTIHNDDDVASVIINTGKLFRDVDNLPNGKKPTFIDFTIDLAFNPHGSGHGFVKEIVSGSGWVPKDPDPTDPDGPFQPKRKTFPVTDRVLPVSGIPGKFTTDYNWPQFPHPWFNDTASQQIESASGTQRHFDCRITFGAGNLPPTIDIYPSGGGGGEEG